MVLRESDGKYSLFDEIWQTQHFWEQTGPAKKKGSEIIRTCRLHQSPPIPGNGFLVLRESDGKYSLFDEIWQTQHFWEQTGPAKKKGSEIIRTCRLHQSPPIPGTVALLNIT